MPLKQPRRGPRLVLLVSRITRTSGLCLYSVADRFRLHAYVVNKRKLLYLPVPAEVAEVRIEHTPALPPLRLFGRESGSLDAVPQQLTACVRSPSAANDGKYPELIRSQSDFGVPGNSQGQVNFELTAVSIRSCMKSAAVHFEE